VSERIRIGLGYLQDQILAFTIFFMSPRAHGALGYTLPAALGAFHARPPGKIVGVMGDASFAMSVGELETIVRLKLPIVFIVLANSCYGWIKAGQKAQGYSYFGVDFSSTPGLMWSPDLVNTSHGTF